MIAHMPRHAAHVLPAADPTTPTSDVMDLPPTTIAVADAVTHYRQIRELTRDELSEILRRNGYLISADDLRRIEARERIVSVDDLMALSYALSTSPARLLAHISVERPTADAPLATGVPDDVEQGEMLAWIADRTSLDAATRKEWWTDQTQRIEIRHQHVRDQLDGAYEELRVLTSDKDRVPSRREAILQDRIAEGEAQVTEGELNLAFAEHRLENLGSDASSD
jgi:hypothetical protein